MNKVLECSDTQSTSALGERLDLKFKKKITFCLLVSSSVVCKQFRPGSLRPDLDPNCLAL